jgi:hypothetical protein
MMARGLHCGRGMVFGDFEINNKKTDVTVRLLDRLPFLPLILPCYARLSLASRSLSISSAISETLRSLSQLCRSAV